MTTWLIAGLAVIFIWLAIDAFLAYKKTTTIQEYFLMDGMLNRRGFLGTATSSNLSLGNLVVVAAVWGYQFGPSGVLWWTINLLINALAIYLIAPRISDYINSRTNCGSIHEYLSTSFASGPGDRYATSIRYAASAATIVCLLLAIAFELHIASFLIQRLLGWPIVFVFCALVAIVSLISSLGGFRAVVRTDIIQAVLMALFFLVTAYLLADMKFFDVASMSKVYDVSPSGVLLGVGWPTIVSICVVAFGWFLVSMDHWQRSCATRSAANSRLWFYIFVVILIVLSWCFLSIGIHDRLILEPSLGPEAAKLHTKGQNPILDLFLSPPANAAATIVTALAALGLVMAAISTADTFLIVCGHSLVSDIIVGIWKKSDYSSLEVDENRRIVQFSRYIVFGMGVFVILAWLIMLYVGLLNDVVTNFFVVYSAQLALLVPVLYSYRQNRPTSRSVYLTILTGLACAIIVGITFAAMMQAEIKEFMSLATTDWATLTPVITVIVTFIVTKITFRWS